MSLEKILDQDRKNKNGTPPDPGGPQRYWNNDINLIFRKIITKIKNTVTDPGCLSRISNPGADFFHPGSRNQGWQDPRSGSASTNLSIFNPKNWYYVLKKKIQDVQIVPPGSGFFLHTSRIKGSKNHRMPDPRSRLWIRNTRLKHNKAMSVVVRIPASAKTLILNEHLIRSLVNWILI